MRQIEKYRAKGIGIGSIATPSPTVIVSVLAIGILAAVAYLSPSTLNAQTVPPSTAASGSQSNGTPVRDFVLPGNQPEQLVWLQDEGFGMFIHWSHDCQIGSVISHSMVGASEEYNKWFVEELPKTFNPKLWDPDEVASLAKIAGMRYVVLTAKHHSGFCLWDTATTDFNITNTPYGKDILKDYVTALRKQGIAVGLYYSPEDFNWLRQHGHDVRRRGATLQNPDENAEYLKFVEAQLTEMFTNYGQIDMFFIDGCGERISKEVCWKLQPNCLITRGAIETPEQFVPGKPPEGAWESNITMGTQWSYKPTNDNYKSGSRIIELLIETRAKGGALMMNIGPKPNGEIPIEQEERMREVALWHAVNGEAVHDTRPWVVSNEDNIWFTKHKDSGGSGDTLFAMITGVPDWSRGGRKEFNLQSVVASDQTRMSVLGHNGKWSEYQPDVDITPRFTQTDAGLNISVCRCQRLYNDHKWPNPVVVKLENVKPAFEVPPYAETGTATADGGGSATLTGKLVELAGANRVEVGFEFQEYYGFAEAMYNTEWTVTPLNAMSAAGDFQAKITGLKPGKEYQYRAVVKHPIITMRGDHLRVRAR